MTVICVTIPGCKLALQFSYKIFTLPLFVLVLGIEPGSFTRVPSPSLLIFNLRQGLAKLLSLQGWT